MALIFVYNNMTGALERYNRAASEPMPYTTGGTLTVREFLGSNQTGWTDTATMNAWNALRSGFGQRISVVLGYAGLNDTACGDYMQHYAGTAFRLRPTSSAVPLSQLYDAAVESGAFSFVQPLTELSSYVSADARYRPSDYFLGFGFAPLAVGSRGNLVLLLQSLLQNAGHSPGGIDGIFGARTDTAVRSYQDETRQPRDGIVNKLEWESLLNTICIG